MRATFDDWFPREGAVIGVLYVHSGEEALEAHGAEQVVAVVKDLTGQETTSHVVRMGAVRLLASDLCSRRIVFKLEKRGPSYMLVVEAIHTDRFVINQPSISTVCLLHEKHYRYRSARTRQLRFFRHLFQTNCTPKRNTQQQTFTPSPVTVRNDMQGRTSAPTNGDLAYRRRISYQRLGTEK